MSELERLAEACQICIEECGAQPSQFEGIELHFDPEDGPFEWRFMGALGFGGKLRFSRQYKSPGFYVTYYPEDETSARVEMACKANERLAGLLSTEGMPQDA